MSKRTIRRAHARNQRTNERRARRAAVGVSAVLGAGALLAPAADAATFSVSNLSDTGAGSLRDAIDQANQAAGPDTITFASGLSGTISVASEMESTDDLTIQGPGASALTLDGGDANRVLYSTSPATSLTVSGLTFSNGYSSSNGGAIFAQGSLGLNNVVITSSESDGSGGGAWVVGNELTVADSKFTGNEAGYTGGGFGSDGYSTVGTGGISITGSVVEGNSALYSGGGIALYDNYTDVVIDSTTVSGNKVTTTSAGAQADGGGIWMEDTYDGYSTTVQNSTVSGNSTTGSGGGISFGENFYGTTKVVNTTVDGNTAGAQGGGVQFADLYGAGLVFQLQDSTVTGNTAAAGAGGVLRGYASGGTADAPLDVSSSIVSGNNSTSGGADFSDNAYASGDLTLGNVLVGSTAGLTYTANPAGSNVVGVDPKLGPLADNGGPTKTRLPAVDSPVIDAGLANGLTKDQRGEARTVEVPEVPNRNGSDGTDIGAVEYSDIDVKDPFLDIESPQKQGRKKVKVKVEAGAGEAVTAQVYGKIFVGKGNAVMKTSKISIASGERATITVQPKKKKATKRILKALGNGRKVTAKLTGKLADNAGNEYTKDLQATLTGKPKKK